MDFVSAVATGITFVTFVKDILAVAMAVKDAIDKKGDNLQDAKDACEDILLLLTGLVQIGEEQGDQVFTDTLSNSRGDWMALEQFKRELLRFHKAYVAVVTNERSAQSSFGRGWNLWPTHGLWSVGRQETTAKDLLRIKDSVNGLVRRFQALALARVEHIQLKHSQMLQRAEHTNRLVLAETNGGRQAIWNRKVLVQALFNLPHFFQSLMERRLTSQSNLHEFGGPHHSRQDLKASPKRLSPRVLKYLTNRGGRRWGDNEDWFSLRWQEFPQQTELSDEERKLVSYRLALIKARRSAARSLQYLDGEENRHVYSYYYDSLLPAPQILLGRLFVPPSPTPPPAHSEHSARFRWILHSDVRSGSQVAFALSLIRVA